MWGLYQAAVNRRQHLFFVREKFDKILRYKIFMNEISRHKICKAWVLKIYATSYQRKIRH